MIRYYLSPIIGTGQREERDPDTEEVTQQSDSYRPALADVPGINWVAEIPNRGAKDGRPKFKRAICFVRTTPAKHAIIRQIPGVNDLTEGILRDEDTTPRKVFTRIANTRFRDLPDGMKSRLRSAKNAIAQMHDNSIDDTTKMMESASVLEFLQGALETLSPNANFFRLYVR